MVDIPEIRRLAATPYVEMCINTIIDEIAGTEWEIVATNEENANAVQSQVDEVTAFFNNPNVNKESFEAQLRKVVRDILTIDSGVWVKVFDRGGNFKEIYARDGGTFTKNPDKFGTFANCADLIPYDTFENMTPAMQQQWLEKRPAYFQYGWITGARPMPFGTREIIYIMRNPLPDSIYGRSPIEVLLQVIQILLYGIDHNLEYFTDNNIPKGVLQLIGANSEDIKAFKEQWRQMTMKKDSVGNWRRHFHKMPITNMDGKFTRVQFSNLELQLLQQQQWFTKLVWACFGITPSELGFTEDSNRATEIAQSRVVRRKTIQPILNILEFHVNQEIVWQEFSPDVKYQFKKYDLGEDMDKHKLYEIQVRNGIRTVNEIRHDMGLEPIEGGDETKKPGGFGSFNPFDKQSYDNYFREREQETGREPANKKSLSTVTEPELFPHDFEEFYRQYRKRQFDLRKFYRKGIEQAETENDMNAEYMITPEKKTASIKEAIEEGVALIKDITKKQRTQIKNILLDVLERPRCLEDLIHELTSVVGLEENKAKAIARTEVDRIESAGKLDAYEKQGITHKKWASVLDHKTSDLCVKLHEKYFDNPIPLEENFTARYKSGKRYKTWTGKHPPAHVNCRSIILGAVKEE